MSMEGIRIQIDPFGTAERWTMKPKFDLQQWPIKLQENTAKIHIFHRTYLWMASGCAML